MLWSLSARIPEASYLHAHEVIEFGLCRTTGGYVQTDDARIALVENRTLLIPPGVRHSYVPDCKPILIKLLCMTLADVATHLSPTQAAVLGRLYDSGISVADHGPASAAVAAADIIQDGLGEKEGARQVHWSAFALLLAFHADKQQVSPGHASLRYKDKIQDVLAWVEEHLAQEFCLDRVAACFGMSRSLFSREFRRHAGVSFVEYCNRRKVEKAALLLAGTASPVVAVAFECGWRNLSHFHREFRKHYGLTPAAFRRKMLEEGGADQGRAP